MTDDQEEVLAQFRGHGGRPLPLFALFERTSVSTREDVQRLIGALVSRGYIEQCLGTQRMAFYRPTTEGMKYLAASR